MGVRGLESYLEKQCPAACRPVSIKSLINKYKQERNTNTVVIVIDGYSCLRYLYGDLNWCLGGQLNEFVLRAQHFVRAFQSLGVTLVLFFDGATVVRKRPVWISRREEDIKRIYKTFDILKQKSLSESEEKLLFRLPTAMGTWARLIFKYECECDVRSSILECDEEVSTFARTNRCFAILGQDTDFVIAEGAEYYLSMKNLDITKMQTLAYDRLAFARAVQVAPWHLPLLATLCGNDVVSTDALRVFHQRENHSTHRNASQQAYMPFKVIVRVVAKYIYKKRLGKELSRDTLASIAMDVFKDQSAAGLIETSVKSYDYNTEMPPIPDGDMAWSQILVEARELHRMTQVGSMYDVLANACCEISTMLEDYRQTDLPPAAKVLRPLRERIYGILLSEKPGAGGVEEWCVQGESVDEWNQVVTPIAPKGLHPGLLALWSADESLHELRWELFASSVAPQFSAAALRSLPPRLVVPAVILCYLRNNIPEQGAQYLLEQELAALTVQAVLVSSTDPSVVTVKPPYNTRAIRLASVFLRAATHMLQLLAACGFPLPMEQSLPWLYFDGKLFHATYKSLVQPDPKTIEELCINQAGVSLYEEYVQLRAAF